MRYRVLASAANRLRTGFVLGTGFVLCVMLVICGGNASAQSPGMVEFFTSGKLKRGLALVEFAHETVVLGRDGQLHSLDPRIRNEVRPVNGSYEPLSATEIRNQLRAEFGRSFDVLATKNFLVVQPSGRGDRWPKLFEQSHRSFVTYMSRRGVKIREGRFPMSRCLPRPAALNNLQRTALTVTYRD